MNSVVTDYDDLLELPIRTGAGPPVSIRDIGAVSDSTDIPTAYASVNGRRAVYIPVTKRPNASTLDVVSEVKRTLVVSRRWCPTYQGELRAGSVAQRLRVAGKRCCVRRRSGPFDRAHGARVPARLA